MASNNKTFSITLTSTQLYWAYLFLVIGDVALAYVAKILPASYGADGLSAIAIAFFATLSHDYSTAHTPNGIPTWLAYVITTAAGAAVGAIGYFTGNGDITTTAFIAWLIVVLSTISTDVAEDAGENLPVYAETYVTTFIGVAVTFLTWYSNNTGATLSAVIATIIAIIVSYFHVSSAAKKSA